MEINNSCNNNNPENSNPNQNPFPEEETKNNTSDTQEKQKEIFKDIQKQFLLKQNDDSKEEKVIIMTLDLENGISKQIKIFPNSDPEQLSMSFCKKNNLEESVQIYLQNKIEQILNNYIKFKVSSKIVEVDESNESENMTKKEILINENNNNNQNSTNKKVTEENFNNEINDITLSLPLKINEKESSIEMKQSSGIKTNSSMNIKKDSSSSNKKNISKQTLSMIENKSIKNSNNCIKKKTNTELILKEEFDKLYFNNKNKTNKSKKSDNSNFINLKRNNESYNQKTFDYNNYFQDITPNDNKSNKKNINTESIKTKKNKNKNKKENIKKENNKIVTENNNDKKKITKSLPKKNYRNNFDYKKYFKKQCPRLLNTSKEFKEVYPFKPKINSNYKTKLNFTQRLIFFKNFYKKRQDSLKNIYLNPTKDEKGDALFKPKLISKNSSAKNINTITYKKSENIFIKNYKFFEKYTIDKEKLSKQLYSSMHEPNNSCSKKKNIILIHKKKINAFKKIFKLLDSDQDNIISGININISKIPNNIYNIIKPVILELKTGKFTLNEDEFISAMKKLYDQISVQDRKVLVNKIKIKNNANSFLSSAGAYTDRYFNKKNHELVKKHDLKVKKMINYYFKEYDSEDENNLKKGKNLSNEKNNEKKVTPILLFNKCVSDRKTFSPISNYTYQNYIKNL